jgi:hypothetical protein
MADLIQHRYFATEAAYNAATKKDTDICFIGDTGRIITRNGTFGNAKSVLESLNTYMTATDSRLSTLEGYFNKTESSANKADKVQVTQNLSNNTEYPMLWTNANANTEYSQLFKSYANMTFNPSAKRITVGSGGGFRISGGTSSQFLKADGSTDSTTYAAKTDLNNYIPWGGGTTTGTLAINANAIYINSDTEIYLKRKFDTGDKTLCVASSAFRPSNTDSHGHFDLGTNTLRFKNGYFLETVYANSFSGSLTGVASQASQIYTINDESNTNDKPIAWLQYSQNSGYSPVGTTNSKLYFNPSTGYVTATGFNGKIGSSTIGGTATPIYLNNGTPTACSLPWPTDLLSNNLIQQKYLPSYVDDVLEYANLTALKAATGETGKIYVTTDNNKVYRWTGKDYIEINSSVSTADTAANAANADLAKKATQLATARTLKIGKTGKTFDGSADVTWTLDEIDAASTSDLNNYLPTAGGTMTGNITFSGDKEIQTNSSYIGLTKPSTGIGVAVQFTERVFRPYAAGTGTWSLGGDNGKWKDGYFTGTVYATNFSGNATSATTATTAEKAASLYTTSGTIPLAAISEGTLQYNRCSAGNCGNLPYNNNANGIITLNTYNGNYHHQLGFSSNNKLYHRGLTGTDISNSSQVEWNEIAYVGSTVAKATTATTANKVANTFRIQYNGSTLWTYNGDTFRSLNIKAGSNVSVSGSGDDTITIAATDTTYSAGAGLTLDSTTFNVGLGYSTDEANRNYAVKASGKNLYVNVPWSDTNTDTKVTSVGNHYTITSGTAKTTTASGSTLEFNGDVITGVNVDAAGHIYSLTTSKLPSNPNTDTKVTSVSNHYTPSGGTALTGTSSETLGFSGQVMTGITRDEAGHITGATFKNLPSNPVPSYSFNTGAGGTKTMAEFLTYTTGRTYTSDIRSSVTVNVTTQNIVLFNGYGDLTVTVNMNGWDFANIIIVGHPGSSDGKTVLIQTTGGDDIYENEDCGLITTTSSKYVVEASIVKSSYGTFVSTRKYGKFI